MPDWIEVAKKSDLAPGRVKVITAAGRRLALARVGADFFALEDLCTHDQGPLGEGKLVGQEVECPRHGARFDVRTGQPVTLPAVVPVRTFPVRVEGETVYVKVG